MSSSSQTIPSVEAHSAGLVESVNPATGEVTARIPATPAEALPGIFARAREAQAAWGRKPLRDRCKLLRSLRDAIFQAREEVVDTITRESGKARVEGKDYVMQDGDVVEFRHS